MIVFEDNNQAENAKILVVGVGGAGCNAVDRMIEDGLKGVEFLAVNTDMQALNASKADNKLQIGKKLTKGLGAGGNPQVGVDSAQESLEEIVKEVERADLVFVTAGMGGGTGTGAAPVVAQTAMERGILTVGVVSKPFSFEGMRRSDNALKGIENLKQSVDSIVVVPNDKLLDVAGDDMTLIDAFDFADSVLKQGVKGITDLISHRGMVNLDFADVETILRDRGVAHMGIGRAEGDNAAEEAVLEAINSPLLETSVDGARSLLVNITGGAAFTMKQFADVSNTIYKMVDEEANIVLGNAIDMDLENAVEVTIIATGFERGPQSKLEPILSRPAPERKIEAEESERPMEAAVEERENNPFEIPDFLKKNM